MNDARLREFFEDWGSAQDRLEEAIGVVPMNEMIRDSVFLRFILVYELAWHTMQRLLFLEGVEVEERPRPVLRHAYQSQWIDDEEVWMRMVTDRNLVVHTYKEETAITLYQRVKDDYAPQLRKSLQLLKEEFSQ